MKFDTKYLCLFMIFSVIILKETNAHGHGHDHKHSHGHNHDHKHSHSHDDDHDHDNHNHIQGHQDGDDQEHKHDQTHTHNDYVQKNHYIENDINGNTKKINYNHVDQHSHNEIHSHDHKHHYIDSAIDYTQQLKEGYLESIHRQLGSLAKDKQKLIIYSVIIVSLPSIPTFLILLLFQKLFGARKNISLVNDGLIGKLIAFSFGTLIGDVFLHILPHLLEGHIHDTHSSEMGHAPHDPHHQHSFKELQLYFYILFGVLFFIFIDYISICIYQNGASDCVHENGHSHSHSHKNLQDQKIQEEKNSIQTSQDKSQVFVFLFGDFLHNFTDGIALGASYAYNIRIGISTTLAILMHETPHEIGDFAYLIKKKYTLSKILSTQIFTSFGCLIGGFIGLYFGEIYKEELLSLTAGGFLYMCLSSIFPDIRESFEKTNASFSHFLITLIFIISGIGIMYGVTFIE